MSEQYRALQVTKPGRFEMVMRRLVDPCVDEVRIRVEACGVCHSDAATVDGSFRGVIYPRVPGHEVIGKIDAIGDGVTGWKIGQRVGVGFLGGHCGYCQFCRRGDFVNCQNQPISGLIRDGGYAEVMFAKTSGLAEIPDQLNSIEAAPLLCAGLTTFNALRHSPARPGALVAVHGIGGLGHLAIQFACGMGFRVTAIARGAEKGPLAKKLGAHHYIDSEAENTAVALQKLGGASVILTTVSNGKAISPLVAGLAPGGRLIVLGLASDSIEASPISLIFAERSIAGSLTGSAIDNEDTLAFSVQENVRPMIESVPLEEAPQAYQRMLNDDARFRMVLTTGAAPASTTA